MHLSEQMQYVEIELDPQEGNGILSRERRQAVESGHENIPLANAEKDDITYKLNLMRVKVGAADMNKLVSRTDHF